MAKKQYTGQPISQVIEQGVDTDFSLAKAPKTSDAEKKRLPGPERSRSTIDLKSTRRQLAKLQAPFRK